jgi:hypothetical protein
MEVGSSGTRSSVVSSTYKPSWPRLNGGWPKEGCRCAVVAGGSPGSVTTSTRLGYPPPSGNLTIRVHPDEQWLELRLPTPLAPLSNTSGRVATYRLSAPVVFNYRADQWAAQAATGAVRYDISYQPDRGRWYLDASWRLPAAELPSLEELRQERTLAVDLNADHVACGVLDSAGNPVGKPTTVPLDLDGQVTACRVGRLRAAISQLIALANGHGCRSMTSTSPTFGGRAGRPSATAGGERAFGARSLASRLVGSVTCWSAWPPTPACGWSRSTPLTPPSGGASTGLHPCTALARLPPQCTMRPPWLLADAALATVPGDGQV